MRASRLFGMVRFVVTFSTPGVELAGVSRSQEDVPTHPGVVSGDA